MKTKLLSPLALRGVLLKNRIAVSPMCQYSARNGFADDWHLVHYGSRAVGGVAMVVQEATAVSPEGRITPADLGLYHEEHIDKLLQITNFIRAQECVPAIQLAHAGRKAGCETPWNGGRQINIEEGGWQTYSSSTLPFYSTDHAPKSMTIDDLEKVVGDFETAAKRAFLAGYEVVEIHAAHGYLIHQFLSPLSNHRTDSYGGIFENRIRLLMEIVKSVRKVWPENLPLFVRISATDWADGGWNPTEATQLASLLKCSGVDLIDCSSGGLIPDVRIPLAPGYQVEFARIIKEEAGIATSAVGLITNARQAEEILQQEAADLVMLGRESLREPYITMKWAAELEDDFTWPLQYVRAKR